MPLPNFLFCGMPKAGSSWIFEVMREHPEIHVPLAKDIMFFSTAYHLGKPWYLNHFANHGNAKAIGEICHDYYLKKRYMERIKNTLPDSKIILCLREPLDWIISMATYMDSITDVPHDISLFLSADSYVSGVKYRDYLSIYSKLQVIYNQFPKEQVKVLFFDDLKTDSKKFAKSIFRFLGVNDNFIPSFSEKKVNQKHSPRVRVLAQSAYRVAGGLREIGLANLVGAVKRNPVFNKILFSGKPKETPFFIDDELRIELYNEFSLDYEKIESLIGRQLPPSW